MKVALFDYGIGNLHSLAKALEVGGAEVMLHTDISTAPCVPMRSCCRAWARLRPPHRCSLRWPRPCALRWLRATPAWVFAWACSCCSNRVKKAWGWAWARWQVTCAAFRHGAYRTWAGTTWNQQDPTRCLPVWAGFPRIMPTATWPSRPIPNQSSPGPSTRVRAFRPQFATRAPGAFSFTRKRAALPELQLIRNFLNQINS